MLESIDTIYDGHRFRSRLEARWAVFFKKLSIKYEYEKEGFNLEGNWYLPDFWLPKQKCWIEIKGEEPTEKENELAHKLSHYSGYNVYIFFGQIEIPDEHGAYLYDSLELWDHHYIWCECPKCGELGIEFEGRAHRLPCDCFNEERDGRGYNADSEKLIDAYKAARHARFEHGEKTIRS
jgi:hypothetical protein